MGYTLVKEDNFVSVVVNDANEVAAGTSIRASVPRGKGAVAVPIVGNNEDIDFKIDGELTIRLIRSELKLQDGINGTAVTWSGNKDALIREINNNFLAAPSSGSTTPTNPTDMSAKVDIYAWTNMPAPDANTRITLKSGVTYNFIGQIDPVDKKAKVTTPIDVDIFVEDGAIIKGESFLSTMLVSSGFTIPLGQAGAKDAYITLEGNSEITDIEIDGGGASQQLVSFAENTESQHVWTQVNWKNGGVFDNNSNNGGIAFRMSEIGNLIATKCGFLNTGNFSLSSLTLLGTSSFDSLVLDTCIVNYTPTVTNSSFLNFGGTTTMNRRIRIQDCAGSIGTAGVVTNFINYNITNNRGQKESFILKANKINIVNGSGLISFSGFDNTNQQALFENNQIEGIRNTYVGIASKKRYQLGNEPTTTVTGIGDFTPILADLSGDDGTGNIDPDINASRLFESRVINGITYFRYIGEQKRELLFDVDWVLSTSSNREIQLKVQKGEMDDQGNIVPNTTNDIEMSFASGTANGTNGTGRPESVSTKFVSMVQYGDYFVCLGANASNIDPITTKALSMFTSKVA